jgi:hypothetical protein
MFMPENAFPTETIIPGTFVRVLSEGLISVGGISTGTVGIVGTAAAKVGETLLLSDYATGRGEFGLYDEYKDGAGTLNLTRSLELLYKNGARKVFARAVAVGANQAASEAAFTDILKEDVQILVAPELDTATAKAVLGPLVDNAESQGKDLIAVIGSDQETVTDIKLQLTTNDRIILTTPGIRAADAAATDKDKQVVSLDGRYSAAAVAGLISSLSPESSPTNKILSGVVELAQRFTYGQTSDLVSNRFLVLEDRQGVRVVRGITTDDGAFKQITTRRITDFAKRGIRLAADPFIGRLNNERVRKALRGAIDGFLTTMIVGEQLISYTLAVTATRQDEIAGRAMVNVVLQPTFSIDYVMVTLVLE